MTPNELHAIKKNATIVINENEIRHALDKLARNISQDYKDKHPIFLIVLNGGLIFSGQLLPKLDILCQIDYCHATRYLENKPGSDIEWKARPQMELSGRHIIIVDDILDEGHTLSAIVDYCRTNNAKSVKSVVLISKQHNRQTGKIKKADYCELSVPDIYVFGFGMDYSHHWRNSKHIYSVGSDI